VKPFVLAAALERGFSVDSVFTSEPLRITMSRGRQWHVRNFQNRYLGSTTLAEALVHSDNSVYVKLALELGLEALVSTFSKVGMPVHRLTPAAAIGALSPGVSPLTMANAYSIFSNDGLFAAPCGVSKIYRESGECIYTTPKEQCQVISPKTAQIVGTVMRDVHRRGTGVLRLEHPGVRAKTGTANNGAWYLSYDDSFRVLVWMESMSEGASHVWEKATTARAFADRVWTLLRERPLFSNRLSGVFQGTERLSVKDLVWMETQFA
jgi:penicillin-binding protein 1A